MNPLVSVVVPVYNRENLILRCLDSVLVQSYRPIELIVVDNNSTDKTLETVKEWSEKINGDKDFRVSILREERKGACAARKKGEENVNGEFVIFFDSDDEMHSDLIERGAEIMKKEMDTDVVCWPCRIHELNGGERVPPFMPKNPIEGHMIHTLYRPQGTLFRREFLKKTGGWNKNIPVWNDFELGLRIILNKGKTRGINKVLADIFPQKDSITGKDFSSKEGEWEKTIEEMRRENSMGDHPEKERIDRILTYREVILAAHYHREGNWKGAKKLLSKALQKEKKLQKLILQFSYHYTRLGGRGVWRLISFAV